MMLGESAQERVAILTIAYERRHHLSRQIDALESHGFSGQHVVIDMGGPRIEPGRTTTIVELPVGDDEALPLSRARNLAAATVDAEILIFLDVDCIPSAEMVDGYADAVISTGGIVAGPVGYLPDSTTVTDWSDHHLEHLGNVQPGRPQFGDPRVLSDRYDLFWSLSFALGRRTWNQIGGFDERFVGYGAEDTDFARSARQHGVEFWFDGRPAAFHQHHPVSSPPVEHLDDIARNARVFHDKWGAWPMHGWLVEFERRGLIDWDPDRDHLVVRDSAAEPRVVEG